MNTVLLLEWILIPHSKNDSANCFIFKFNWLGKEDISDASW